MENTPKRIEVYENPEGKQPFSKWIHSLKDKKAQSLIFQRLDRVALGNFGNAEPVGEGVQELKIHYGPGYRIYFSQEGEQIVLLLIGGDKSTQSQDIQTAKRYLQDYRRRDHG